MFCHFTLFPSHSRAKKTVLELLLAEGHTAGIWQSQDSLKSSDSESGLPPPWLLPPSWFAQKASEQWLRAGSALQVQGPLKGRAWCRRTEHRHSPGEDEPAQVPERPAHSPSGTYQQHRATSAWTTHPLRLLITPAPPTRAQGRKVGQSRRSSRAERIKI